MSLTFKLEIQSVKLFILQKLTYIKLSQPTRFCRSRRRVQTPPLEERAEFLISRRPRSPPQRPAISSRWTRAPQPETTEAETFEFESWSRVAPTCRPGI